MLGILVPNPTQNHNIKLEQSGRGPWYNSAKLNHFIYLSGHQTAHQITKSQNFFRVYGPP